MPRCISGCAYALTFSIAHGIALGFIAYVVIKALGGRIPDQMQVVLLLRL